MYTLCTTYSELNYDKAFPSFTINVQLQDNYQQQIQNKQRFQELAIKHQCPASGANRLTFITRTRAV